MRSKDLLLRTLSVFDTNHFFRSLARIGEQWQPCATLSKFFTRPGAK